jgi:hypothetical protein
MYKPISLFIKFEGGIKEIVSFLEELTGLTLVVEQSEEGNNCRFILFDIEYIIFDNHGLEDDGEIIFSNYRFEFDLRQFISGQVSEYYQEMFESVAKYLASRISKKLICEVMIVENLQRKIALFLPQSSHNI